MHDKFKLGLIEIAAGQLAELKFYRKTNLLMSVLRRTVFRYKSKYKKVGVLPIRIVKSNVSSIGPSSERNTWQRAYAQNVRLYYSYRLYTNLFYLNLLYGFLFNFCFVFNVAFILEVCRLPYLQSVLFFLVYPINLFRKK